MSRFSFFRRLPVLLALSHAYVAMRLAASAPAGMPRWVIAALVLLSYLFILGGFFARRSTGRPVGDLIAWIGFLVLGLFSWLFVLTVLRDILLLAGLTVNTISAKAFTAAAFNSLQSVSALAVPALSFAAVLIGLFNARRTAQLAIVDVALENLPPALSGLTIAQVSDLHVGPTIKRGYVEAIVDVVNKQSPDIVALTGDLVDGSVARLAHHTEPLGRLRARHGVYAVTGNHEYYSGADQWVAEFRRLGLEVLMNQHQVLMHDGNEIVVAGITDYGAGAFDAAQASDPVKALQGAPATAAVRILLAHQPRSASAATAAGFDLQLSGHTHGGQFWPWKYFVPLQQPFVAGLHQVGTMQIYVSRGSGYWGPPMRLGARSEITLIRLRGTRTDKPVH